MTELITESGRRIAYSLEPGAGPVVVFCGGYGSDMLGTKATDLQGWARATGRAFVRFDYSGHGQSSGNFRDGTITDWTQDAVAVISAVTCGPLILVGSSMGGWIALLIARAMPERIAAFVGVAAAPDFTQDLMWMSFSDAEKDQLKAIGWIGRPSPYSPQPEVITMKLIDDGARNLVLREPLDLPFPVRLLHGSADSDVPVSVARRLLDHASGPDMRLTIVKDADHRFSSPRCLAMISETLNDLLKGSKNA